MAIPGSLARAVMSVIACAGFIGAECVFASPTLDPGFGIIGVVRVPGLIPVPAASALQPDSRLLVAGVSNGTFGIWRFTAQGALDPTFGQSGFARVDVGGQELSPTDIAILPDGRILVVGNAGIATVLVRLFGTGTLDPTFGAGGNTRLTLKVGGQGNARLTVRPDGKVVVLENSSSGGFFPSRDSVVEWFTVNGTSEQVQPNPCKPTGTDIAVDSSGKVIVAGAENGPQCVARFGLDGMLDASFGTGGVVQLPAAAGVSAFPKIAVQPLAGEDRYVLSGTKATIDGPTQILRLLPNGAVDAAFGADHQTHTTSSRATSVAFSCGDKVIAAYATSPFASPPDTNSGLTVTRFNGNGTTDATFADDGSGAIFTPIEGMDPGYVGDVLVGADGAITLVATDHAFDASTAGLVITRYQQADCRRPRQDGAATVVEYFNASLGHYFISNLIADQDALDSGRLAGWSRTGFTFPASVGGNLTSVCRYYIPPAQGDSHFFGLSRFECSDVSIRWQQFVLETRDAFRIGQFDGAGCPSATPTPGYRVWNGRLDTNHRYTTSRKERDAMVAKGWIAEGIGPDAIAFCTLAQ